MLTISFTIQIRGLSQERIAIRILAQLKGTAPSHTQEMQA